jgi:hypothetical protein
LPASPLPPPKPPPPLILDPKPQTLNPPPPLNPSAAYKDFKERWGADALASAKRALDTSDKLLAAAAADPEVAQQARRGGVGRAGALCVCLCVCLTGCVW